MAQTYQKDPAAVLDYSWSWSDWLEQGDTITDASVVTADGLTIDGTTLNDSTVTAWLSGGTARNDYRVTCQITTAAGRVDERSITIQVRER